MFSYKDEVPPSSYVRYYQSNMSVLHIILISHYGQYSNTEGSDLGSDSSSQKEVKEKEEETQPPNTEEISTDVSIHTYSTL